MRRQIIPCGEIDEAREIAASLPEGTALLVGERQGLPIPGFDLGNSPGDFTAEVCEGKTLVMTTTNGTRAILASLDAERVYIASFGNLRATSTRAVSSVSQERPQTSGAHHLRWNRRPHQLGGQLAGGRPGGSDRRTCRQSTSQAVSATTRPSWWFVSGTTWNDFWRDVLSRSLLSLGRGGRNLDGIGLAVDFDASSQVDHLPLVAMLEREPLRVVAV